MTPKTTTTTIKKQQPKKKNKNNKKKKTKIIKSKPLNGLLLLKLKKNHKNLQI